MIDLCSWFNPGALTLDIILREIFLETSALPTMMMGCEGSIDGMSEGPRHIGAHGVTEVVPDDHS